MSVSPRTSSDTHPIIDHRAGGQNRSSKIRIRIQLSSNVVRAGGIIYGYMKVSTLAPEGLLLGDISVEFTAYEEIKSKVITASQSFISSRILYQASHLPPSKAVHGEAIQGHWQARRGRTTFPFSFPLPEDAPSSATFDETAALRYVVTAVIHVSDQGSLDTMYKSRAVAVVASLDPTEPMYQVPSESFTHRRLFLGGVGPLRLHAGLPRLLYASRQDLTLRIRVSNATRRRLQGVRIGLGERILVPIDGIQTPVATRIIGEQSFDSVGWTFESGEERDLEVRILAPEGPKTLRAKLFSIDCFIQISISTGVFAKPLQVEVPLILSHPLSFIASGHPKRHHHHHAHQHRAHSKSLASSPYHGGPRNSPAHFDAEPSPPSSPRFGSPIPYTDLPPDYRHQQQASSSPIVAVPTLRSSSAGAPTPKPPLARRGSDKGMCPKRIRPRRERSLYQPFAAPSTRRANRENPFRRPPINVTAAPIPLPSLPPPHRDEEDIIPPPEECRFSPPLSDLADEARDGLSDSEDHRPESPSSWDGPAMHPHRDQEARSSTSINKPLPIPGLHQVTVTALPPVPGSSTRKVIVGADLTNQDSDPIHGADSGQGASTVDINLSRPTLSQTDQSDEDEDEDEDDPDTLAGIGYLQASFGNLTRLFTALSVGMKQDADVPPLTLAPTPSTLPLNQLSTIDAHTSPSSPEGRPMSIVRLAHNLGGIAPAFLERIISPSLPPKDLPSDGRDSPPELAHDQDPFPERPALRTPAALSGDTSPPPPISHTQSSDSHETFYTANQ